MFVYMKVLVTGGLGFIGSHTVVELVAKGFDVHIIDNLSNSRIDVLTSLCKLTRKTIAFDELDLRDEQATKSFFEKNNGFDGVIHFAASKAVGESVEKPLDYYRNNIGSLLNLLGSMIEDDISNFIFSSSCTVYGQAKSMPITEDSEVQNAMSPYGNTKKVGEEIIEDVVKVSNLKAILLRYFNPIGAHPSSEIGELPIGVPQNLVPFITQTAIGKREQLSVFGDDYPTPDGTPVRDYIDVVDLAKAHVIALSRLISNQNESRSEVFNLGTGKGLSVLDVIKAFEKATGKELPYQIVGRRDGDVIEVYANTDKANRVLNWKAEVSIEESLLNAWNWEKKINQ